jgi:hypothetical protein
MHKAKNCENCLALQSRYNGISCGLRYPLLQETGAGSAGKERIRAYKAIPKIPCPKPETPKALAEAEAYSMPVERRIRQAEIPFPDRRKTQQETSAEAAQAAQARGAIARTDRLEALADAARHFVTSWPYSKNEAFVALQKALDAVDAKDV